MKRGGPIKRRTRLKAKRSTKRRVAAHRVRSEAHKAAVRKMGCISRFMPGARCWGPIDASHNDYDGTKGASLKTSDLTCIPQCRGCHDDVAELHGPFEGWTGEQRSEWFAAMVVFLRSILVCNCEHCRSGYHPHTQVEPLCPF